MGIFSAGKTQSTYFLNGSRQHGFILVIALTFLLSACAGRSSSSSTDLTPVNTPQLMEYRIGPADVLSISVRNHADLDTTVVVRPDGMVSFPLLGQLAVVGKTPETVQNEIAILLQEFINIQTREVAVVVDAIHSYAVSVLGEVRLPGRFQFQSQITVLDALAQAGGLTEFASRNDILILRPKGDSVDRIRFDYREVARSGRESSPILVYPGDIILVP